MAPIHNRMPVILPPDAFDPWLSGEIIQLGPYPPETITAHPVNTPVNKPANDDPRCVEPIAVPLGQAGQNLGDSDERRDVVSVFFKEYSNEIF